MSALTKLPEKAEYFVQGGQHPGLICPFDHRLSQPETNIKHFHISCKIAVYYEDNYSVPELYPCPK